ncbi:RICIN domain-containing protein [Streptosporangium sp. NBC_01495]|uniref:RICIN domain-containing protein n=1 Tax=Streptosporangium sp. NBC_01495 TaxID=2903899 RepID=UPI002E37E1DD|nr:RICIN domain-containing protein [Streptosporangium sp. NBC_01495]
MTSPLRKNLLAVSMALVTAGAGLAVAEPAVADTGTITNRTTGKCIGAAGGATANGTAVDLYGCVGSTTQQWTLSADGTIKTGGKCLDVAGAATGNGAKVQLYDCNGTNAQKWYFTSAYDLINVNADKCLDLTGNTTADFTKVQLWTCTGAANQKWAAPGGLPSSPGSATGATYYVDPANGSAGNPGTAAAPWRTLQEVFASGRTFGSGDVIYLRSGNHGSPVITGGVASGTRTIRVEPGQTPRMKTLRFSSGATRWTVDGVLVSPQEADNTYTTGNLVQFDAGASNNVLRNSQVRAASDASADTWSNGDWVSRSGTAILVVGSNNQLLNNQIRNVRNGVMLERTSTAGAGATGAVVRGNSVNHFWEDAYRCKVSGCLLEYNSAVNSYAVVPPGTENDPPHRDMFQSYRGDGSFTPVTDVVLRGNVFISRLGTRYSRIPFQYNGKYTIQGIGAFDGPYRNWTIENNVVQVEVGIAMGLYGMNDSRIVNNTVVPRYPATSSEIRLTNQKDGTPSNNNIIRNNLARTFNTGAATNSQNSNNITVGTNYSAFFVDHPGGNLHLRQGAPAINAGTTANAPALDADQKTRTTPYDVGAYEF